VLETLDDDILSMLVHDQLHARKREWAAREQARMLLP
jgi:hypothetical protein